MNVTRKMIAAVTLTLGLATTGCESDCEKVCEDSRECPGAEDDFLADIDCGDICDIAEDLADAQGCLEEFDELNACGAEEDDVCDSNACQSESQDYGDCIGDD